MSGFADDHLLFPPISQIPWTRAKIMERDNKFFIFASHGLWDHMDEQKVVEIVDSKVRFMCFYSRAWGFNTPHPWQHSNNPILSLKNDNGMIYQESKELDTASRKVRNQSMETFL